MNNNIYSGEYVRDLQGACQASIISKQNMLIQSVPGWGKTQMLLQLAQEFFGTEHVAFIPLTPTTPPERIRGSIDIEHYLETSKIRYDVSNTAYDPNINLVLMDEIGRMSEVGLDAVIHSAHQVYKASDAIHWGTTNFTPTSTRTKAVWDRFPIVFHIDHTEKLNLSSVLETTASLMKNGRSDFPLPPLDPDRLELAHEADPTQAKLAMRAIADFIELIGDDVLKRRQNFKAKDDSGFGMQMEFLPSYETPFSPRQVSQFFKILYPCGVYYSGKQDFRVLPEDAKKMALYCFKTPFLDEYQQWRQTITPLLNTLKVSLERIFQDFLPLVISYVKNSSSREQNALTKSYSSVVQNIKNLNEASELLKEKLSKTSGDLFQSAVASNQEGVKAHQKKLQDILDDLPKYS